MSNDMFYTYIHRKTDDGTVFYIGKGKEDRAFWPHGRSIWWNRIVKKHGLSVEICARWPTEQEAFDHEKFLIWCFKDIGIQLANFTDGGEGIAGFKHTDQTKALLSQRVKARMADPEQLAKITEVRKKQWTDAARANAANSSHQLWAKQEVREQHSKTLKAAYASPERRAMQRDKSPIVQRNPDVEVKRRAGVQRYWESYKENPEQHLSRSEIVKRGWETRRKLNANNQ